LVGGSNGTTIGLFHEQSGVYWHYHGSNPPAYQPGQTMEVGAYWYSDTIPDNPNPPIAIHTGVADKRDALKVIEWIDSGAVIDHETGGQPERSAQGDGYQIGLNAKITTFMGNVLEVGWWDVDDNVTSATVVLTRATGATNFSWTGTRPWPVTLPTPLAETDSVAVDVRDAVGNHARLEKSIKQLWLQAEPQRGL